MWKSEGESHSVMSDSLQPHGMPACQTPLPMEILQARILEWAVISFSRGSSQPKDPTQAFCIAGRLLAILADNWESRFLGRLIRSPGFPRRRKGDPEPWRRRKESGALKEKRTKFISTLLCLSQHNNVSCWRTCFSLTRIFWLILSS